MPQNTIEIIGNFTNRNMLLCLGCCLLYLTNVLRFHLILDMQDYECKDCPKVTDANGLIINETKTWLGLGFLDICRILHVER